MNRLKLYTGGFPLRNDDFDFMQNQINLPAFYNIIRGFSEPNGYVIIWGCQVVLNNALSTPTSDVYDVSEGAVVYNYEIVSCPSQQIIVPKNAVLQMRINTTYPASGSRQYIDTSTHFTYEIDEIIVEEYDQQGYELSDFERLGVPLKDLLIQSLTSQNIPITLNSGWSYQSNPYFEFSKELRTKHLYSKISASQAFISAQASTQSPYSEQICTLPAEARPQNDVSFIVKYYGYSAQFVSVLKLGYIVLDIETDGTVTARKIDDEQNKHIIDINVSYL